MKYVCLVFREEATLDALPAGESAAIECESREFREGLRRGGHCIAAAAINTTELATTVRVRNGTVSISDSPSAAIGERLGEVYLIEARDLNEAIRIASRMPLARLGCIEVRSVTEGDRQ